MHKYVNYMSGGWMEQDICDCYDTPCKNLKILLHYCTYCQVSNISHTWVGNEIVDHSDVVGASPVGVAPTTPSFSTEHLASIYCAKTTASRVEKHFSFGIWCDLCYKFFTVLQNSYLDCGEIIKSFNAIHLSIILGNAGLPLGMQDSIFINVKF